MTTFATTPSLDPKPLALVTGASRGIGLELAKQFARNGFDLIINSEDPDRLGSAASELGELGAGVRTVAADLRSAEGVATLYRQVSAGGTPLSAAALNAGVGQGGPFLDTDIDDEVSIVDLNITSTLRLAKLVLRDMVARDEGRVLVTSSVASTMPGTFQSVYNASKSFLQSWAEAVQNEIKDSAVTITSLMPGPTETDFFRRADMGDTKVGTKEKDDPAQVAEQGFQAMMNGDAKIVAGSLSTKGTAVANSVLPDSAKAAAHRYMAEPGSADR